MNLCKRLAAWVAAILVGCHGGRVGTVDAVSGETDTAPGPSFSLRILGTDVGEFRRASLDVAAVQVKGPQGLLASKVMTTQVDLSQANEAWLLSSFHVPEGVDEVEFVVSFSGGHVEIANRTMDLDAGCSTLHLRGRVNSIAQRRHAVIQVDVARSLIPGPPGFVLVPQYQLVY